MGAMGHALEDVPHFVRHNEWFACAFRASHVESFQAAAVKR